MTVKYNFIEDQINQINKKFFIIKSLYKVSQPKLVILIKLFVCLKIGSKFFQKKDLDDIFVTMTHKCFV